MKPIRKHNPMTSSKYQTPLFLIASFVMPILILVIIAWKFKLFPFASDCFMTREMQENYIPVIAELRRKLLHGESLFYTWNAGGGSNFWTRIACYAASPFNLIYLLFPQEKIAQAAQVVFVAKTAVAALSFAWMLKRKDHVVSPVGVGLATAYALCGYVLTYSQEPWMLDVVILLPLLFLSLSNLIQGTHKWTFAVVCGLLAMMAFQNAVFMLAFILMIFPLLYIEQRHKEEGARPFGGVIKDFFIYLFLGLALTAIVWYPALLARWNAVLDDTLKFPSDFTAMDLKVWDFLERACFDANVIFPSEANQLPSVYCGIFPVVLVILYGFSSKISITEKIYTYCSLVVMYISMSSRLMLFVSHGLHFPVTGSYPQAILITIMVMYMAARVLSTGELFQKKTHLWGALGMILAFMIIRSKISYTLNYADYAIYMAIALIVLYFSFSAWTAKESGRLNRSIAVALMLTMVVEAGLSFYQPIKERYYHETVVKRETSQTTITPDIREVFKENETEPESKPKNRKYYKLDDSVLYRVRDEKRNQIMDEVRAQLPTGAHVAVSLQGWANNGLLENVATWDNEFYLSSIQFPEALRKFGINDGEQSEICVPDGTPITNTFFNMPLRVINDYGEFTLAKNETAGSNGFFTPAPDIYDDIFTSHSAFANQNELAKRFSGIAPFDEVVMDMSKTSNANLQEDGSIVADDPEKGMTVSLASQEHIYTPIYIHCNCKLTGSMEIMRMTETGSEQLIRNISLPTNSWIEVKASDLQEQKLSIHVNVMEPKDEILHIAVASMDPEKISQFQENMKQAAWNLMQQKDGRLSGTIDAPTPGNLVLCVPYEEGWEATIDGQSTTTFAGFDTFLAVHVPAGQHEVKFVYRPRGLKIGMWCTAGSAVLLVMLTASTLISEKKKKQKTLEQETVPELEEEELS